MKPFTIAEIVKIRLINASDILFDQFSNKDRIVSQIEKILQNTFFWHRYSKKSI